MANILGLAWARYSQQLSKKPLPTKVHAMFTLLSLPWFLACYTYEVEISLWGI